MSSEQKQQHQEGEKSSSEEQQQLPPMTVEGAPSAPALFKPLVQCLAQYVASESAAVDGEWEYFSESHQLLLNTVSHLKEKSGKVTSGIEESTESIDAFLNELNSRIAEVDATLSVLESVSAGLEEYSFMLQKSFVK